MANKTKNEGEKQLENRTLSTQQNAAGKRTLLVFMAVFALVNIGLLVYSAAMGRYGFLVRGVFFPVFLLIPLLFKWLGLQPCYRLYCLLYAFILFAYSFGCVYGAFTSMQYMDKISHFASGFVFTIAGFCLFYLLQGATPGGLAHKWPFAAGYALFFSMFVGVMWEFMEFFDFIFTGNDSQNTLTTGVFDTMQDLLACFVASLLSVGAFILYRYTKIKLLTPFVLEEFYEKNIAKNGESGGGKDTPRGKTV